MRPGRRAVFESLHADFLAARMRLPWVSPDLQTLRNTLRSPKIDLSQWPATEQMIAFRDGDDTLCYLHSTPSAARSDERVLLVHGLGGDASGAAVHYLTRALLKAGLNVARINLRAAPMVFHLASGISHAGKTEDLADIMRGLEAAIGPQKWFALGISLGGNMLAKALGDGALAAFDIAAAMTICAPLDMQAASDTILKRRNAVYQRYLLRDLKTAVLETGMEERWKEAAASAGNVFEFDDKVTGPFHGFGDAPTYYAQSSAGPYLPKIAVPTLLLTAQDDPWIPASSYRRYPCPPDASAQTIIAHHGGHVGFHFKGSAVPAYCQAATRWFTAAAS